MKSEPGWSRKRHVETHGQKNMGHCTDQSQGFSNRLICIVVQMAKLGR